jgi:hypothetical protein
MNNVLCGCGMAPGGCLYLLCRCPCWDVMPLLLPPLASGILLSYETLLDINAAITPAMVDKLISNR